MTRRKVRNFQYTREAYRSIQKKQYGNAVAILEKSGESGLQSEYNLFLMSLALVYNSEFQRAGATLARIERLDPCYIPYVQLKSFLSLKSAATREQAIGIYIEALETVTSDRLLKKILREIENTSDFPSFQKNARLQSFVAIPKPSEKSTASVSINPRKRLKAGWVILALFTAAVSSVLFLNREKILKYAGMGSSVETVKIKSDIDSLTLGNADYGLLNRINREKTPEFYHSRTDVISDFNRARSLIKDRKYNEALVILNRINNSNVNYIAREKVEFLIKFVIDADERKYAPADFARIKASPHLYRGVSIQAKGRTANVQIGRKGTSFTLMADYSNDRFSEVVGVFSKNRIELKNGEMVNVRGIFIPVKNQFGKSYISAESLDRN